MKEHKLFAALLLTVGLVLAPIAVLAEEEKGEDEKPTAHHEAKTEPAPPSGKTVKKAKDPKTQAAEDKAAVHPHGVPGDDDEEEGSH